MNAGYTALMLLVMFFLFTTMPVMMFDVVFNVQIKVIQLIQVMQVDKCRVYCNNVGNNVLKCGYKDASYGV